MQFAVDLAHDRIGTRGQGVVDLGTELVAGDGVGGDRQRGDGEENDQCGGNGESLAQAHAFTV